jgi:hypothetical protein
MEKEERQVLKQRVGSAMAQKGMKNESLGKVQEGCCKRVRPAPRLCLSFLSLTYTCHDTIHHEVIQSARPSPELAQCCLSFPLLKLWAK